MRIVLSPAYLLPGGREVLGNDLIDGRAVAIYELGGGKLARKIVLEGSGKIEVIDFLDFSLMGHHWPAFNVADAAITVGVGFLILHFFRHKSEAHT